MELICLGDSLTFGYGVPKGSRWTTRLAQKTGWRIYNFGVCGDTTGGMLTRLVGQISPQLPESWGESGPAVELIRKYGLDSESIYTKIKNWLK